MSLAAFPQGPIYAYGFSWRKRRWVRRFTGCENVLFRRRLTSVPSKAALLVWGTGAFNDKRAPANVWRIEDGFLRSVGLGADLVTPVSWVVDGRGIYYDSSAPSDLEILFQYFQYDPALLQRAAALRELLVREQLSKYNLRKATGWIRPHGHLQVVLVTGQVESDASLERGAPGVRTNIELLKAVRLARPAAFIVYKPHPDVVAGLRAAGEGEALASDWCDQVLFDARIEELYSQVDEIHVLTSLAGFEALLRGVRVVCHGQPFYAGWGLTEDLLPISRRTRHLSLDALVAGALILYPVYLDPRSGQRCEVEQAVDALIAWRRRVPRTDTWFRRLVRPFLRRP